MATLLLLFAIIFLMGALVTTGKSLGASKVRKELEGNKNYEPAETGDQPLACDMLVTRVFEQRMVDAGIMKVIDMSVCDQQRCSDCQPTKTAKFLTEKCAVGNCRSKGIIRWNENELLCASCHFIREESTKKPKHFQTIPAKRAKRGDLQLAIEHNGATYTFDWPKQIPTHAHVSVDNNFSYANRHSVRVWFRWTHELTGKPMGQQVMFPILMTAERRTAAIRGLTGRGIPDDGNVYS